MLLSDDWISTTEAGRIMGVSARTVRNYIGMRILKSRRYPGRLQVLRSEATAFASYEDPLEKARSLIELAKSYAMAAKFPPGRFNDLIDAMAAGREKPATRATRAPKSKPTPEDDLDSILG